MGEVPSAWVSMPSEEDIRALLGGRAPGYDFGFVPAMARLVLSHLRLAPHFGSLFTEIMFSPDGVLERREREMVAGVASAAQDCFY